MDDFKDKLSRVEETSEVKRWVTGLVELRCGELHSRADRQQSNIEREINNIMAQHLTVPNIVGPTCEFKTLPSYLTNLNKTRSLMLDELEDKHQQVKMSINDLSSHLDDLLENQIKEKLDKL